MKDRSTAVTETVNAILAQAGLDERYRADFSKLVGAAFDAGAATTQTVFKSEPLNAAEIAGLRSLLSK